MKIVDLVATPIAIPTEAPLRHSRGVHPGRFQRNIIELFTDEGIVGLGEVGGGDKRAMLKNVKRRITGEDPFHVERIRQKILRPFYYRSIAEIYSAVEIACLDIQGKALGRPVSDLIGGRLRDQIPCSAYLFYRYDQNNSDPVETPRQMAEHLRELVERYGFQSAKLKGGVFPPEQEIAACYAIREAMGSDFSIRIDPNGIWSTGTAIIAAKNLEDCNLEYLEDPTWGIAGMARVHQKTKTPLATNMCVTAFDDFPQAIAMNAVDIILADVYYWEGITGVSHLGRLCETFRLGLSMHSGTEFGITLAAMLHVASCLPNLTHDIDAHYHHLVDDVIIGGKLKYTNGKMSVPDSPGLGVEIDQAKLKCYANYYEDHGDYYANFHADERRPQWIPVHPAF